MLEKYNYFNENGTLITGAPAFCHEVFTVKGGIENYNNSVIEEYKKKENAGKYIWGISFGQRGLWFEN